MLGGLAMKWRWRQRREAAGLDATRPNMVLGSNVQVVWEKKPRRVIARKGTAADKLTRQGGASLRALVQSSVEPHASDAKRLELEGDDIVIDRIQITPLGLVRHELATNAVK